LAILHVIAMIVLSFFVPRLLSFLIQILWPGYPLLVIFSFLVSRIEGNDWCPRDRNMMIVTQVILFPFWMVSLILFFPFG